MLVTIGDDHMAQTLPDITLPLVTGGELAFRDLRGTRRLLFMWGSW